jgi:hypothetical protein
MELNQTKNSEVIIMTNTDIRKEINKLSKTCRYIDKTEDEFGQSRYTVITQTGKIIGTITKSWLYHLKKL